MIAIFVSRLFLEIIMYLLSGNIPKKTTMFTKYLQSSKFHIVNILFEFLETTFKQKQSKIKVNLILLSKI